MPTDQFTFEDVLTGAIVTCDYPGLQALSVGGDTPKEASAIFFPGCSFLNYGLPLVQAAYDLLLAAGRCEGISLLCCGKILSYEPDGKNVRAAYEQQLRDAIASSGVTRIITVCPNCVHALRPLLAAETRTAEVKVVPLSHELSALGYRIDATIASRMLAQELSQGFYACTALKQEGQSDCDASADPALMDALQTYLASPQAPIPVSISSLFRFQPKDSCPDRSTAEFARGLRSIMPQELLVEGPHQYQNSVCCGSRARAAQKFDLALQQAQTHSQDALSIGVGGIVTACFSCTFLLSQTQFAVPVFHYLELLYNWRIPWHYADQYMKLRFLIEDPASSVTSRPFVGLGQDAHTRCQGACNP